MPEMSVAEAESPTASENVFGAASVARRAEATPPTASVSAAAAASARTRRCTFGSPLMSDTPGTGRPATGVKSACGSLSTRGDTDDLLGQPAVEDEALPGRVRGLVR